MLLHRGKGARFGYNNKKYASRTPYILASKRCRRPAHNPSYYCHEPQQQSLRWFTTSKPNDKSTNKIIKSNKNRRKPRSLSAYNNNSNSNNNAPRTTKERIRWLQDHNQALVADNHYRRKAMERRIDDAGQVMEERLKWMRGKIYGFWRSDYEAKASHRPGRVGPKMDAKWWFWNLCFALLPAVGIATYCELIAKPAMVDYNRQVYIREQKKLLGDAYVEEEDEELKRLTIESEPFSSKLYDAVYDLASYFLGQMQGESQVQDMNGPDDSEKIATSPGTPTSIQQQLPATQEATKDAQTVAELKQKLEELEHRLNERHNHSDVTKSPQMLKNGQPVAATTKNLSRIQDRALGQRQQEARHQREKSGASMSESDEINQGVAGVLSRGIAQMTDTVQKYWKAWSDVSLSSESTPTVVGEQADATASSSTVVHQESVRQGSQQRLPTENLHADKQTPEKEPQSIEGESGDKGKKPWYRRLF